MTLAQNTRTATGPATWHAFSNAVHLHNQHRFEGIRSSYLCLNYNRLTTHILNADTEAGRRLQKIADMVINPTLSSDDAANICDALNEKAVENLHDFLQLNINPAQNITVRVVTLRNDVKQTLNDRLVHYHAAASNQQLITWTSITSVLSKKPHTLTVEETNNLANTVRAEKAAESNIPSIGHFFHGIEYCARDSKCPQVC